jgi:hypothetical protein
LLLISAIASAQSPGYLYGQIPSLPKPRPARQS